MILIEMYEVWKTETEYVGEVWARTKEEADRLAGLTGGQAIHQLTGIVVPDESYLAVTQDQIDGALDSIAE